MKFRKFITAAALTATLALPGARAQDNALPVKETAPASETTTARDDAASTRALINSLRNQIEALDQKVKVLERKDEIAQDASADKKKTSPTFTVGEKGIQFESADKKFSAKLGGLLQVDSRNYIGDDGIKYNDGFVLRRARLPFSGKVFENWEYQFTPEFGGTSAVSILDANLNAHYWDAFQVKAGKFKEPIGLEVLQSDPYREFAETSLASNLVPNRDIGVMAHGNVLDNIITYQAGVFNGGIDGQGDAGNGPGATTPTADDEYEFVARIFTHPFKGTDINELKGFGVGFAGSIGDKGDSPVGANAGVTSGYKTAGQETFFTYQAATHADGDQWRLSPQGYYYYGPFGFLGEYVLNKQDLANGAHRGSVTNNSWQVSASYVLTGEDATYTGVVPKNPFNISNGTWGAFEVVGRYDELEVDDEAYKGPAATAFSAGPKLSGASAWGLGLNWYLNRNVRVLTNFYQTDFHGGSKAVGAVTSQNENVFITRLQLNF